ncbi:phosphate ABC transporter substrate-binding protein [Desertifilum sp. FACHB-1129]|uniref:Phosphate ABC transporter substrate-binding protein n=1 Tax=Desertifilum tharense IPPAS B-1220 TaxID=1781255 RepID=A0A1E5QIM4_9CYAN|nr:MULTISPECIES: phosphate ABC transporter substrate-binding protein [Desertifilum]MDA0212380.1 phosphate ABC transporter substrate-binding protein [Cyanobacteria bacterium FC1]MBD2311744.1 phosphate ABC transporter substrate-binding protein [Desertifilum sp. FACHB-1129]MBD2322731.1 phosphate ABC transporter substrate-binding protein [Desertifilum sp. FACHB-866]MBD2332875.1 phosphate ABC transporter substrate-binding protein [Desertifilum sp. FACHB-868]OEJ74193.1 phosphate ABC transporter subs
MTQKNSSSILVFISFLLLLLGGGYYWFFLNPSGSLTGESTSTTTQSAVASPDTLLVTQPNPTVLAIDGSVTMVRLVKLLQNGFSQQNPNIPITYGIPNGNPTGSNGGMANLIAQRVQLAATSRPLNATEVQAGLQAIPVARDALAIVIGASNPFSGSLTLEELKGIFQGQITNWSEVGGPNVPIRVLNRSPNSGSYTLFQEMVLLGEPFGQDGTNFVTYTRDVTTPILQALRTDGISYTTVAQAQNQQTVKIIPINGILPTDAAAVQNGTYPISRNVFFAVPKQTSPVVKAFIDFARSPQGQQFVQQAEFIPIP